MRSNTNPKHTARKGRWASRGAAYAETVVMLPFFIAVWTCMIYVHKAYSTKLYVMAENRTCVVGYAFEACRRAPPGCPNVRHGVDTNLGERPSSLDSLQGLLGGVGNSLLGALFGESASSRSTRNVDKPRLLGGGSTQALAGHVMACNTERTTPADMVRQAFCEFVHICL